MCLSFLLNPTQRRWVSQYDAWVAAGGGPEMPTTNSIGSRPPSSDRGPWDDVYLAHTAQVDTCYSWTTAAAILENNLSLCVYNRQREWCLRSSVPSRSSKHDPLKKNFTFRFLDSGVLLLSEACIRHHDQANIFFSLSGEYLVLKFLDQIYRLNTVFNF